MRNHNQGLDWEVSQKFMQFDFLLRLFFKKNRRDFHRFGDRYQGQGKLLTLLALQPIITQKELTKKSGMRPQSASEMITKLEKRGYIRRYKSESDRRVMIIELTKDGKEVIDSGSHQDFQPIVLNALTEEEKEEFGRLLDKLIVGMDDVLGPDATQRFEFFGRRGRGFRE